MPSYEPTPRRFSVITVSRSASRRNSIDDATRPSLATGPPPTPSFSSPVDLAEALRQLQHAQDKPEGDDGRERGRSRQVVGERAIPSTWGHDEPIKVPAARRENSASTRNRIAMWEQRSRSQSKGRSKSRARDLGAGSRISVVPEIPEIQAALSKLGEKERTSEEKSAAAKHALKLLEGQEQPTHDEAGVTQGTPWESHSSFKENAFQPTALQKTASPDQIKGDDNIDLDDPWRSSEEVSQQEQIRRARDDTPGAVSPPHGSHSRPQTSQDFRVSPQQLPTPDGTPRSAATPVFKSQSETMGLSGTNTPVSGNLSTPLPPSTPIRGTAMPAPPLTPEATPGGTAKRSESPVQMSFGEPLTSSGPLDALHITSPPVLQSSPGIEPSYRPVKSGTVDDIGDEDDFGLPTLPSAVASKPHSENKQGGAQREPTNKVRAPQRTKPIVEDVLPEDEDARYHNVWRIQGYEPEFGLPAQPVTTLDADVQPTFSGNPLQGLPKSQLSAEAEPYKPLTRETANPYPYANKPRRGDFAVDIPPSPTTTYVPGEHRRQHQQRSRSRNGVREGDRFTRRNRPGKHEWDAPPVIERVLHAASVSAIQGLNVPLELYRGLRDTYYPLPSRPDIIKAYSVRRRLPVRIFFPSHYDLTSPALLPTLFTIHGGGFTVGSASDDDAWNRSFADSYTVLVIALNYAKAPWAVFPSPLLDAEALYHAVLNDESLPIDRMRTALCGFDAGANLALGLAQLPSVKTGYDPSLHAGHEYEYDVNPYPHQPPRSHPPPAAVVSVCGILDFGMSAARKARTRPYKRSLKGPRGWGPGLDWMAKLLPSSAWSYIPYGHDISDPLLSPAYASRVELPPHVFVVAAELDCLAHESWRTACSWAGRAVPDTDIMVGRRGPSQWRGSLDDGRGENAAKFGWAEKMTVGGVEGSTRWLLVPDVVHGFDSAGWRNKYLWGDEEARLDSEMKTIAYQRELAEWLWGTVWR